MLLDLRIYKLAKKAIKDMPLAIKQMDKAIVALLPYRDIVPVTMAVTAIMKEKAKLQVQLAAAESIKDKKARLK